MRLIVACAPLMALVAASAAAQEADAPAKDAVTDAKIIDMCGGRLAKMFAQYGTPVDLWAARGNTPDKDEVICNYHTYMFRVRGRVIQSCFFAPDWKGLIRGIKIGNSREDVVKVLGNPSMTFKDKAGVVTAYGYALKGRDASFFTNFNKDGKVWRVEVSMK